MKIEDSFGISEHPKFTRLHVHISILVYIHVDLANIIYIVSLGPIPIHVWVFFGKGPGC